MPNLKELKVSVGKIPGLNLGEHLSSNNGLHHLHLVLSSPGGSGQAATNLHRELQSPLPVSLNRVYIEASKMPILHPAALKVSIQHQNILSTRNICQRQKDTRWKGSRRI